MLQTEFPCPSCGFLVFEEETGSYDICGICGWEDDHVQLKYPGMKGGANGGSLFEYQEEILKEVPADIRLYEGYERDKNWRPLKKEELLAPPNNSGTGVAYFNEAISAESTYYWLDNGEN